MTDCNCVACVYQTYSPYILFVIPMSVPVNFRVPMPTDVPRPLRNRSRRPQRRRYCTYCGDSHEFNGTDGKKYCEGCLNLKIFQPNLPPLCTNCENYYKEYKGTDGKMYCERCRTAKVYQSYLPPLCTYCGDYHQFENPDGNFVCDGCKTVKQVQSHIFCK
jgi:hypothetical protein